MAEGAGEDPGAFDVSRPTISVKAANSCMEWPWDRGAESGQAQTALIFTLGATLFDPFGVDHNDELVFIVSARRVCHKDSERDTYLWGSETDSRFGMHGLDHVRNEGLYRRRNLGNVF
tara:strand:+ start:388 stop:741 length:354 start_codon:yes stop_codon:yes gene_type:complete